MSASSGTIPVVQSPSVYTRLENLYLGNVRSLFVFLTHQRWNFFASVLSTFLVEPHHALRAGYLMHKGLDTRKFTNLNPTALSPEQLTSAPVLLIHGDSSSSGVFAPMVDQITKEAPDKPIFTIDLRSADGIVSAKNHLGLVMDKVHEIAGLYSSSRRPKISFVGHSSGGDILPPLVQEMQKRKGPLPGTIIKIGSVFKKVEAEQFSHVTQEKVIEIVGTRDVLEGCESYLPDKLVVASGHLGLLFNETVLKHVSKEIKESPF